MPFVRKHGNQVAIVHGERDPETGQVQQRVLFSLYSKPEVDAALGRRPTDPPLSFRSLVASRDTELKFDWPKLDEAIAALESELPESYPYPASGVAAALRLGIVAFTKGILAANPQDYFSAGRAIRDQRRELLFVREMIDWRLQQCETQEEHQFNRDNEFGWLSRMAGTVIPVEAMEWASEAKDEGEREALAGLFVEAWPEYADGHNTLGLVALEREDYDRALACFQRTMEVGRRLFPKRIAKSRWWSDHHTRPYIRGMRNTAMTLLWSGRYEEVLPWCDRLEQECHDQDAANVHRAAAFLNLGRWTEARDIAARYQVLWPTEDLVAAFAAFELGDLDDAAARWLHAAIQSPRAARMLVGLRGRSRPEGYEDVNDHNAGVELLRSLTAYLARRRARKFFSALTSASEVVALIEERRAAVDACRANRGPDRTAYDRMAEMATLEFARQEAARLGHVYRRKS